MFRGVVPGKQRGEKGKLNMIIFTLDKKTRKTLVFRAKTRTIK